MELFPVQDKEETTALVDVCACSFAELGLRILPWSQILQCRVAGVWTGCSAAFPSTLFPIHLLLNFQSFDWLVVFHLELWQAIIFIVVILSAPVFLATCFKYCSRGLFSGYCFFKNVYYKLVMPNNMPCP
jgi:hypothetical protein